MHSLGRGGTLFCTETSVCYANIRTGLGEMFCNTTQFVTFQTPRYLITLDRKRMLYIYVFKWAGDRMLQDAWGKHLQRRKVKTFHIEYRKEKLTCRNVKQVLRCIILHVVNLHQGKSFFSNYFCAYHLTKDATELTMLIKWVKLLYLPDRGPATASESSTQTKVQETLGPYPNSMPALPSWLSHIAQSSYSKSLLMSRYQHTEWSEVSVLQYSGCESGVWDSNRKGEGHKSSVHLSLAPQCVTYTDEHIFPNKGWINCFPSQLTRHEQYQMFIYSILILFGAN